MSNDTPKRKPWYRGKRAQVLLTVLAVSGLSFWYLFYRPIQVTRGPWEVLDPGKPEKPLKFEVVEEGTGAVVEPGDLILISIWVWSRKKNKVERLDREDWWVWVGFRTKEETPFYTLNHRFLSIFVGQRGGGVIKLLESSSIGSEYVGEVAINPFGSYSRYKNDRFATGKQTLYLNSNYGYEAVRIEKVFKGQLRYRTTHLYDGTWYRHCIWFNCWTIKTPRQSWKDDARYDGVSADGKRATFQYGPVSAPGRKIERYGGGRDRLAAWTDTEWQNLPKGVQVE